MIHGIDAVGGDVHFEDGAVLAEVEDAFNGYAAEGEVVGELAVGNVELWQVFAEPLRKNLHANCSRKRWSPE